MLAYELSLINGCGTRENNILGASEFTNIIIFTKQTNKYKEKFVILKSIGTTIIKSRKTRAVIYTCRYSSGQFNS